MKKNKGTKVEEMDTMVDEAEKQEDVNLTEVASEEKAATSNRYKFDVEGKEVSRSNYIKHLFIVEGKTRSEIEAMDHVDSNGTEVKFEYKVVYSALINMDNGIEDHRERGGKASITVFVNPETNLPVEEGTEGAVEKTRKDVAIALYAEGAGMSRGDIAKLFGVKSPTIYAYTKPADGTAGSRAATELKFDAEGKLLDTDAEDFNEELVVATVKRSDFIKQAYAEGYQDIPANDRGAIASFLSVAYQTVYQATPSAKALVTVGASTLEEFDTKVAEARLELIAKLEEANKPEEVATEDTAEVL